MATHVLGLATWLVGRGHEATVIAPGTVHRTPTGGVTMHLLGRSQDFHVNGSVAQLALGPRQCAEAVRASQQADVVHVHEPLTPGLAFAVARHTDHPVLTHHASFHLRAATAWVMRRRAALLHPGAVIAVSSSARVTARAATGWEPDVIGNGVLLPEPPPTRTGWRGGERPRIGFLGRLDEPRKGFTVFRDMASSAPEAGLDAEFVAIGPGRVRGGGVRHLGAVDDATRNHQLQRLDVVVAPNLFGESFGLVLVEALAAGCAVVASDLPGFRDVLQSANAGSLFPPGDPHAGLVALRGVLQDPPDPAVMYGASRQWGWDALGPLVVAHYRAALARTPGPTEPIVGRTAWPRLGE
ncbi:glycosyltransferase family 4 protein [Tessaracoccus sp.]